MKSKLIIVFEKDGEYITFLDNVLPGLTKEYIELILKQIRAYRINKNKGLYKTNRKLWKYCEKLFGTTEEIFFRNILKDLFLTDYEYSVNNVYINDNLSAGYEPLVVKGFEDTDIYIANMDQFNDMIISLRNCYPGLDLNGYIMLRHVLDFNTVSLSKYIELVQSLVQNNIAPNKTLSILDKLNPETADFVNKVITLYGSQEATTSSHYKLLCDMIATGDIKGLNKVYRLIETHINNLNNTLALLNSAIDMINREVDK